MRYLAAFATAFAVGCQQNTESDARVFGLDAEDVVSGYTMLTPESQALQDDDFINPGLLWVDQGQALFEATEQGTKACASCHEDSLTGVAARYPKIDEKSGALFNIESRINACRQEYQQLEPLDYEGDALLSLTAYVAHQSKGLPVDVVVGASERPFYELGQEYFYTRRGQFNLSCHQCHDQYWGKRLRGDTISQGHATGFPTYRLEWQSLGSSHRRLRDCDHGVRAEPLDYGDETYIAVELYLAARAQGLELESPAVRR